MSRKNPKSNPILSKKQITEKPKPRNFILPGLAFFGFLACLIGSFFLFQNMFPELLKPGSLGLENEAFERLRTFRVFCILGPLLLGPYLIWFFKKEKWINWFLGLYTFILSLSMCELYLMFTPKSDAIGTTVGHALWTRKYGMNDFPFQVNLSDQNGQVVQTIQIALRNNPFPPNFCQRPKLCVVGDSFTYGDGIDSSNHTYVGKLQSLLPQVDLINLGSRGLDSYQESVVLTNYFVQASQYNCPNLVGILWQFYANDVEQNAERYGYKYKTNPPGIWEKFAEKFKHISFINNYLYYFISRKNGKEGYKEFLQKIYADPRVVSETLAPILAVAKAQKATGIQFKMVIFPLLTDLAFSDKMYSPIYRELQANGIDFMKVSEYVGELEPSERIVHSNNPHPSEKVHQIVADGLFGKFFKPN